MILRSTHHELDLSGHCVRLEVSHLAHTDVDMLYSLIEIWLYKNCKSDWDIEQFEKTGEDHKNHVFLHITFKDPSEAMYFKLSPQFLHNRPIAPLFLCEPGVFK